MVAIAIVVGIVLFNANTISSNKDAILNDLNTILADAYEYAVRPESLGGGEGSYDGYEIPDLLAHNENGSYSVSVGSGGTSGKGKGKGKAKGKGKYKGMLTLVGTSAHGYGTVTMVVDDSAAVKKVSFTGEFQ